MSKIGTISQEESWELLQENKCLKKELSTLKRKCYAFEHWINEYKRQICESTSVLQERDEELLVIRAEKDKAVSEFKEAMEIVENLIKFMKNKKGI